MWEQKVCSNNLGHVSKMAAMPIYGKNSSKASPEPKGQGPWGLVCGIGDLSRTKFKEIFLKLQQMGKVIRPFCQCSRKLLKLQDNWSDSLRVYLTEQIFTRPKKINRFHSLSNVFLLRISNNNIKLKRLDLICPDINNLVLYQTYICRVLLVIKPQLVCRTNTNAVLTGPFSTCAGFIYHLFALNIKISRFGGPAKTMLGHPATCTLAYSRAGACCACSRCRKGWAVFLFFVVFFFISSILSSFSNASSLGRRLDILKCCGIGRYNPRIVVSYYQRHAC